MYVDWGTKEIKFSLYISNWIFFLISNVPEKQLTVSLIIQEKYIYICLRVIVSLKFEIAELPLRTRGAKNKGRNSNVYPLGCS